MSPLTSNILMVGLILSLGCGAEEAITDTKATAQAPGQPVVVFETSKGNFEVELYADKAPTTVKNFLRYVDEKFYDDTVFHRIMENFMIQGGGYKADGAIKNTHDPIKNESGNGVKNDNYHIAMARTQALDSATSQFYINTQDNPKLDSMKYCAFGKVISGTEVIDQIKKVPVVRNPMGEPSKPTETVTVKTARLKVKDRAAKGDQGKQKNEIVEKE